MRQRQRLSLHIPTSPPSALPESPYTPSSDPRRRSLISLGEGFALKPTRARLQKLWPGAKSPTTDSGHVKDYNTDLSALIVMAGEQMAALGDPRMQPVSPLSPSFPQPVPRRQRDDPKLRQDLELTLPKSATSCGLSRRRSIHRKPLPSNSNTSAALAYAPPSVPMPRRAPPPPPIPELSAINFRSEELGLAELESPSSPIMPATSPVAFPATARRRAKTPVHHIGQLERATRQKRDGACRVGNADGVQRMSSVSTIAREYRELAVYSDMDVADVPKTDPSYLLHQGGVVELPVATQEKSLGQEDGRLGTLYEERRKSSPLSDHGPGSDAGSCCPSLAHSSSPPAGMSDEEEEEEKGDEAAPSLASLRFQNGLELLTKELSTAFANQSARRQQGIGAASSSPAGLQIWVMIEAYERLREQLDANLTEENKQVRHAIDSWIRALYAIHANFANEAAADESEYESD